MMNPNLEKCARDYSRQEQHFRVRTKRLMIENGVKLGKLRGDMLSEARLRRMSRLFGVEMSDLLGTTCEEEECKAWHTNPNDR